MSNLMEADSMRTKTMEVLQYDTYLEMIRGSVYSRMFRTMWAKVDGERKDILQGGELSCAFLSPRSYTTSGLWHPHTRPSPDLSVI